MNISIHMYLMPAFQNISFGMISEMNKKLDIVMTHTSMCFLDHMNKNSTLSALITALILI